MDESREKFTESLTWLDWLVYFLIGISVAMVFHFGIFGNTLICVILAVMHRFTLRKIFILIFPDAYRVQTGSDERKEGAGR